MEKDNTQTKHSLENLSYSRILVLSLQCKDIAFVPSDGRHQTGNL